MHMTQTHTKTMRLRRCGRRRRAAAAAAAFASIVLTAGCSSDDTATNGEASKEQSAGGGTDQLVVDAPGTTAQAAAFLGAREGDFADAGLDVTVHPHTAADSPLVGLMAGEYPIVWTSAADILVAQEKGLPVAIVADSDLGQPGTTQVIVKEDSPIKSLEGLESKTIGIPGPTSSCAVTIPAALRDAGVDPATVKLTPVALTDHGTALERGVVDAVCTPDPFLSIIESQVPSRTVIDTFAAPRTSTLVGVYATTTEYASKNADVIEKFRDGLEATNKRLNADQNALRAAIPTFTQVDAALAEKMALPMYAEDVTDPEPVKKLLVMMMEAGLVKSDELSNDAFVASN